jgi:predicted O-methyltransferase YrrM
MPTFTVDWTTQHIADWETHLGHLNGRAAIGLEIGVFEGRSTEWFCRNVLDHEKSRLICVDTFAHKERYGTFLSNMIELDLLHKLDIRRQPSEQMMLPPNYLDFARIDGWHSADAVMMDSMIVWRSLKAGGICIWDDVHWPGPNVKIPYLPPKPALDAFLHIFKTRCELLLLGSELIVKKLS